MHPPGKPACAEIWKLAMLNGEVDVLGAVEGGMMKA
jgi:hypothetical protein